MKFLHSWLLEYIIDDDKHKVPQGQAFSDIVSINAFEVEYWEELNQVGIVGAYKDFVYEIDILPNRNHDCLGHYFMAKELATIFNLKVKSIEDVIFENNFKIDIKKQMKIVEDNSSFIKIFDKSACSRFMGAKVSGINVSKSPEQIKYRLESIGQKSINNIVDITNYVQFTFNKPMHAYDSRKVKDFLGVRFANLDEALITLDEREIKLDEKSLIIADNEKVLGLAGIKGGKLSGIKDDTNEVIVESANFNPTLVRKTAQKYDLRTDASKRFENELDNSLTELGLFYTLKLLKDFGGSQVKILEIVDNFPDRNNFQVFSVSVSVDEINNLTGLDLSLEIIQNIFKRFGLDFKINGESFIVSIPNERLDLRIKEDLIEEVLRVYGLNNIKSILPELKNKTGEKKIGLSNKTLYFENKIKNILFNFGFSEIYNYTMRNKGQIEIIKSLSQDKNKLRVNLADGLEEILQKNIFNLPLLDTKELRVFEFGNVFILDKFNKELEERSFCFAIEDNQKNKNYNNLSLEILEKIKAELGLSDISYKVYKNNKGQENCLEVNFSSLIQNLAVRADLRYLAIQDFVSNREVKYKNFPLTPFIVRDIAVWTPKNLEAFNIEKIIRENISLLVKSVKLFDQFEKEDKKSFAFRLIYQDDIKTLTNGEISLEVDKVYQALKASGFEIR